MLDCANGSQQENEKEEVGAGEEDCPHRGEAAQEGQGFKEAGKEDLCFESGSEEESPEEKAEWESRGREWHSDSEEKPRAEDIGILTGDCRTAVGRAGGRFARLV